MPETKDLIKSAIISGVVFFGWIVMVGGLGTIPTVASDDLKDKPCVGQKDATDIGSWRMARDCLALEALTVTFVIFLEVGLFLATWLKKPLLLHMVNPSILIMIIMGISSGNVLFSEVRGMRYSKKDSVKESVADDFSTGSNAYAAGLFFLIVGYLGRIFLNILDLEKYTDEKVATPAPAPGGARPPVLPTYSTANRASATPGAYQSPIYPGSQPATGPSDSSSM